MKIIASLPRGRVALRMTLERGERCSESPVDRVVEVSNIVRVKQREKDTCVFLALKSPIDPTDGLAILVVLILNGSGGYLFLYFIVFYGITYHRKSHYLVRSIESVLSITGLSRSESYSVRFE